MSKLQRLTQLIFGASASSAPENQIGVIGSLANGSAVSYSGSALLASLSDLQTLQSLSNYGKGLGGVCIGNNSPAIQDFNGLFFLTTYQLAYLMQAGVAEWDTNTIYFTNSLVNYNGLLYQSLIDSNNGNTPSSSPSDWQLFASPTKGMTQTIITTTGSSTYTTPTNCISIRVRAIGGGGGSGGAQSGTGGAALSVGGSGGSYVEHVINAPAATYAVSVGAGGAGGPAGVNDGSVGGNTTFGTVVTAIGGAAGFAGVYVTSFPNIVQGSTSPTAGNVGDIIVVGGASTPAALISQLGFLASQGGSSPFAMFDAQFIGQPFYGGGGGGVYTTTSALAGVAGGNGVIIVDEFY